MIYRIPAAMSPLHLWGSYCLNETVKCPGCGEVAIVGDSIAYRYHLYAEQGALKGCYIVAHSYDCLLHFLKPLGKA